MRLSHRGILYSIGLRLSDNYIFTHVRTNSDPSTYRVQIINALTMEILTEIAGIPFASYLNNYIGYDSQRNLLMFFYGTVVTETDLLLNPIRTVQLGATGSRFMFYKDEKYYQARYSSSKILIYNVTGISNILVHTSTVTISAFAFTGSAVDDTKTNMYVNLTGNGTYVSSAFLLNISNMSAITSKVVTGGPVDMSGLYIGKNYLLNGIGNIGGFSVIEERSLDYDTLIKQVITALASNLGSYNTRYPVGKDKQGNYYLQKLYTLGGSQNVVVYKIGQTGTTIFTKTFSVATIGTFTPAEDLICPTAFPTLSLLSKIDGSILASASASTHVGSLLVNFGAGNIRINS